MKRANGSGSVVNYGKGRRRPYAARVTVGWDGDKQQTRTVGYYATRQEAEAALVDFTRSPYDIDARKITMAELYERWLMRPTGAGRLARHTVNGLRSAYNRCARLHDVPYANIRAYMMQDCIDACGGGGSSGTIVRNLFRALDKLALEMDILNRTYSSLTVASVTSTKTKHVFTDVEVGRLWDNAAAPWVDAVLVLLYSGWRASELLDLRCDNINLDTRIMRGGIKTKSGKDRVVPIHSAILPLVEARYNATDGYLFGIDGKRASYTFLSDRFRDVMGLIGIRHTIHETRHTFRTWLDSAGANKVSIDLLMGHKSADVGERVYTHKTIEELRTAVGMIRSEQSMAKSADK